MGALDPTLPHIAAGLLAIVFLGGAWQKLRDLAGLAGAIEQYRLLPAALVASAARMLVVTELAAGLLLLPVPTRAAGAALAALLLGTVTLAVLLNLLRGRADIDCGCGGPEGRQHLSWGLVLRNALLGAAALAAAGAETRREPVWLDGLTVIAGTLALYGLYAAANQLMANRPRLLKLKG